MSGETGSSLPIVSVPVLVPGEAGEKSTVTLALSPAAMEKGAAGEATNSAELDEMLSITKGAVPLFFSQTNRSEVVPLSISPKSRALLESESNAPIPVADKDTVVGLPDTLWTMERVAVFVPAEVGAKVTVTTWAAAPTLTVKVIGETVNCEASVPLTVIPVTSNAALPVFDTVKTFCEVNPTLVLSITIDEPDKLLAGTPIPVPLNDTPDGLPDALWTMERVAVFVPAEVGAKVTVTTCAAAPTLTVKVVGETVNCEASVPLTVTPVTRKVALPVFDTVKIFCEIDPTFVLSITMDESDKFMLGTPTPVPASDIVEELPVALCGVCPTRSIVKRV